MENCRSNAVSRWVLSLQRRGRLVRQGNENKNVHQYRYVTKGTFDAYSYQLLESKQNFISQIMTSNAMSRNADDVDQQALNYSEIKALCIGDERLKQRADMENEVTNMQIQKREHDSKLYEMQDFISAYPERKNELETLISNLETDKKHVESLPIDPKNNRPSFKIKISETKYTDRKDAAEALKNEVFSHINERGKSIEIGEFMGFPLSVAVKDFGEIGLSEGQSLMTATLSGATKYTCDMVDSFDTNIKRMESSVFKIDKCIQNATSELNELEMDYKNAQKIIAEPFDLKSKDGRTLSEMKTALKELTEELARSAANTKKDNSERIKTCYFARARLRKNAENIKKQIPDKDKSNDRKKQVLE